MAFCVTFSNIFTTVSTSSNAVSVANILPVFTATSNPSSCAIVALTGAEYAAQNTAINKNTTDILAINTLTSTHTKQISALQATAGGNLDTAPYNYGEASAMWAFAFITVLMHWFLAKKVGFFLNAIRRF